MNSFSVPFIFWAVYIQKVPIFGGIVLRLLNTSSCILRMQFFFFSVVWFCKWRCLSVVLLLVDVVGRAWELPIHHKRHNLAANTTARGSHTQGDRSWEITLLRTVEIWLMHEHADQNMTHSPWLPLCCTGEGPLLL